MCRYWQLANFLNQLISFILSKYDTWKAESDWFQGKSLLIQHFRSLFKTFQFLHVSWVNLPLIVRDLLHQVVKIRSIKIKYRELILVVCKLSGDQVLFLFQKMKKLLFNQILTFFKMNYDSFVLFLKLFKVVIFLFIKKLDGILCFHNSLVGLILRICNDFSNIWGIFLDDKKTFLSSYKLMSWMITDAFCTYRLLTWDTEISDHFLHMDCTERILL